MKLAVAALLAGGVFLGCGSNPSDNGGDDGNGNDGDNGSGNTSALIGEWKLVEITYSSSDGWSEIDDFSALDDRHYFYAFSSPNKAKFTFFEKVDNFWIESSFDESMTWSTKSQTLYINEGGDIDSMKYSVYGNTLTLTSTYENVDCYGYEDADYYVECYTHTEIMKFTKTTVASLRNTLGTVRTQDSRLSGDTYWKLDDNGEWLTFYLLYFHYDGNRYFEDFYGNDIWYTSGSNLFLLGTDWECLDDNCNNSRTWAKETVQFTYTLGTSGGTRTLTLTNSSKGINDVWREVTEDEYYNSPASALSKSRQGKRSAGGMFKPFWSR
jgi:hypothetical protein